MADHKVTVEQLPSGKWACFLHVDGHESVTAIEMMLRKVKK